MGNKKRPRPIRLTNRTAIGLRKSAQRVRSVWLIVMGITTMIVTVLSVYLGFSWLPAVPLTLMAGGAVIAVMMIISRSQYLLLISQAICTEAASRQMEERRSEQRRREKAIEQLAAMRADVREAQKNGTVGAAFRGEESLLFDLLTGREPSEEEILAMRHREEDEEMYAAAYQAEEEQEAEEDLYPLKKAKHPENIASSLPVSSGNTRTVIKTVKTEETKEAKKTVNENAEETGVRRRRRRSAPSGTAPLQLIRNDQAQ